MLRFPVRGRTLADLKRLSEPQPVAGGTSEALVHALYDTATYVDNTTTALTFFTTTRATQQLSNVSPAGTLPSPQYFEIYGFMVDMLAPAANPAQSDVHALLIGSGTAGEGAPTFQFTYADKTYGPWVLTLLHGTGGISGFGYTTVVATGAEYANNSIPDGGFYQDGAIVLAPNQAFRADIVWGAAQNITANMDIRVTIAGVLHRRVV